MTRTQDLLDMVMRAVPRGSLPEPDALARRHRVILTLLWLHVPAIYVFAATHGHGGGHGLLEAAVIGLMAASATWLPVSPRAKTVLASLGLMMTSAVLVHLGHGMTEMHFHFFVMLSVITLYQTWLPFLTAIGFVVLHHGVLGVLAPEDVYGHLMPGESPWKMALVHGGFILAASICQLATWHMAENEHRQVAEQLRTSEKHFRSLIQHSKDAIAVMGFTGDVLYESEAVDAVIGRSDTPRENFHRLERIHPDDVDRSKRLVARLLDETGSSATIDVRWLHTDGSYRWLEVQVTNLLQEPAVSGMVVSFHDISDRKQAEGDLTHKAFHDPLTGLANRALFLEHVERALVAAKEGRRRTAVVYVDLDGFKEVNDRLGHDAGDEVLIEVANRLRSCTRPNDTCARLGGDEFAIVLDGLDDPDLAREVGERIVRVLGEPIGAGGTLVNLGGSVGIALTGSDHLPPVDRLVRDADQAMYAAKHAGKGCYQLVESPNARVGASA